MNSAVSLFSGCGGLCEGIKMAGFDILCAVEHDKFAAETYRFNFPKTPLFHDDIRKFLKPDAQLHQRLYGLDKVDMVFGGPPCQGFSQIGTRTLVDERNFLFKEYCRVVSILQPAIFIMENVPNLLLLNKGHFKDLILKEFEHIGYAKVAILKLTATDYGVPQERNRIFFVGINDGYSAPNSIDGLMHEALATAKVSSPVTVWEAISDLPRNVVPSGETMRYPKCKPSEYQKIMRLDCDSDIYTMKDKSIVGASELPFLLHNHHTKEIQERRLSLIKLLEPGKKADSLPKSIWDGKRPEKWRRLHPNLPAYTILANMHRDLSEFVHPKWDRWITVREAARLQSFHDGFIFKSSEWQQLKQIGNAVPPILGRAIGIAATALLQECKPVKKAKAA